MKTLPVRAMPLVCLLAAWHAAAGPLPAAACKSSLSSPEGRWRVQDELGTRAVVEVALQGAELVAVVREIVPRPGEPPEPRCEECDGAERGKPIRGLEILRLAPGAAPGTWKGSVLDPEEGRRYSAKATLADCGRVLELRGYVLLPIFGRVERWQRAD